MFAYNIDIEPEIRTTSIRSAFKFCSNGSTFYGIPFYEKAVPIILKRFARFKGWLNGSRTQ